MTAARILSQHGNVIAADFGKRPALLDITVKFKSETLFCDGHIMLVRSTASMNGKTIVTTHVLGDLATGHVTTL